MTSPTIEATYYQFQNTLISMYFRPLIKPNSLLRSLFVGPESGISLYHLYF